MIRPTHCQCLLFAVREKTRDAKERSSEITFRSLESNLYKVIQVTQVFALIPEAFLIEHPKFEHILWQKSILIVGSENVSSFFGADDLELIEILLDNNPTACFDPLTLIMDRNYEEDVRLIFPYIGIMRGCDKSVEGLRPAVDDSNSEAFNRLLAHRVASRHGSIFKSKSNVLHVAAKTGHEEFVRVLLDQGADINCKDIFCAVPLHEAAYFGRIEVVQLLLNRGAAVDARERGECTPLHLAAWKGNGVIVRALLDHGASIDCRDLYDRTPLHYAATGNQPEVVRVLVGRGSDIESKDKEGHTPLFRVKDVYIAEMLLQNGADVNAKSKKCRMPIFSAAETGPVELVDTLLKYGAQANRTTGCDKPLLNRAYRGRQYNVFKYLLESTYVNPRYLEEIEISEVLSLSGESVEDAPFVTSDRFRTMFDNHFLKVAILYNFSLANFWDIGRKADKVIRERIELKRLYEQETQCLKSQGPCNAEVSWLDILGKNESQVARFLKNNTVAEMSDGHEIKRQFPFYGRILKYHLLKGNFRKSLIEEGIKSFNFLSVGFKRLPYEMKENIFSYLSNQDILVFSRSCKRPNASLENRKT